MKTLILFFLTLPVFAQTPVTFNAAYDCAKGSGNVIAHNAGDKTILAFVATYDVFCGEGNVVHTMYSHDFFYKAIALESGKEDMGKSLESDVTTSDTSKIETTLLYVQFDDGSTWGDVSAADHLFLVRRNVGAFLAQVRDTPDEASFQSLIDTNKDAVNLGGSVSYVQMVKEQSGLPALKSLLSDRLAAADVRNATGKY